MRVVQRLGSVAVDAQDRSVAYSYLCELSPTTDTILRQSSRRCQNSQGKNCLAKAKQRLKQTVDFLTPSSILPGQNKYYIIRDICMGADETSLYTDSTMSKV